VKYELHLSRHRRRREIAPHFATRLRQAENLGEHPPRSIHSTLQFAPDVLVRGVRPVNCAQKRRALLRLTGQICR
jgi:hypothetical protein